MRLYHRTPYAESIIKNGFKDAEGTYLTNETFSGVWISDKPLTSNEGAKGEKLLMIYIPENVLIEYEWIEEDKPYREFLIPASVVNGYGKPEIVECE
jgi:hypothetical protein